MRHGQEVITLPLRMVDAARSRINRAGEGENTTPNDRQEIRSAGDNDHSKNSAVGNFDRASREGEEIGEEIAIKGRTFRQTRPLNMREENNLPMTSPLPGTLGS
jgi:hypothetical protein